MAGSPGVAYHSGEGASQGIRGLAGADAGAEHRRPQFLYYFLPAVQAFHKVGLHHLAAVGDGVVEHQDVQRRLLHAVAYCDGGEVRAAPGLAVVRVGQQRRGKAVKVELHGFVAQFVPVQLVYHHLGRVAVVLQGQVAEGVVGRNFQAVPYGDGVALAARHVVGDVVVGAEFLGHLLIKIKMKMKY